MHQQITDIIETINQRCETLGFAESCTGGALTQSFAQIPGVSSVLRGGIVAYHPEVKIGQLHVHPQILQTCGIVSRETAIAMAAGAAQALAADWAAATTGYAGPTGGDSRYPVGTVCYAIICPKYAIFHTGCLHLAGSRPQIIQSACQKIIQKFHQIIAS